MSNYIDFCWTNIYLYEPLTGSTNTLGYPDSNIANYRNTSLGTLNAVDTFNALMLHRNGPYHHPMWKQIRHSDHPVIRNEKNNNIISVAATPTEITVRRPTDSFTVKPIRSQEILRYTEPVVDDSSYPLVHTFKLKGASPNERHEMKYTFSNNITNFANASLNELLNLNLKTSDQLYEKIRSLYLNSTIAKENNPIEKFISLKFSQKIFPKRKNTGISRTRGRENFEVEYWNEKASARRKISVLDPYIGLTYPTRSIWPLDEGIEYDSVSLVALQPGDDPLSYAVPAGEGQLQSRAVYFHNGNTSSIGPGPLYVRRQQETNPSGNVIFSGDTRYEANTQSGKNPFYYKNYEEFASDVRSSCKGLSVIPEFRISDHMSYYINDKNGNFLAENTSSFSLTGSSIENSSDPDFFETYSFSDLSKIFRIIKKDHEGFASPQSLTLKCKGYKKLLPYDGFYPVLRSLQLATLFSSSLDASLDTTSSYGKRSMWQSFFSPGIFYNTIRSGLAVEWRQRGATSLDITGSDYATFNYSTAAGSGGSTLDSEIPRIKDDFEYSIPFEQLLDGRYVLAYDMEPNFSSSAVGVAEINNSSDLGRGFKNDFKLAMHNFLAESINFFLPENRLSFLSSLPENDPNFGVAEYDKYYFSYLILNYHSGNYSNISSQTPIQRTGFQHCNWSGSYAFGPPVDASANFGGLVGEVTASDYSPFQPPYWNGDFMGISFRGYKENSNKYTLEEIMSNLTFSLGTSIRLFDGGLEASSLDVLTTSALNKMRLTASFNYKGITEIKAVEYEALTGKPVAVSDPNTTIKTWVIQPKFECPILDFRDSPVTLPASTLNRNKNISKGMWLSYSDKLPQGGDGVFYTLEALDPAGIVATGGSLDLTGSINELVGFPSEGRQIGKVADSKEISEAIVLVPVKVVNSARKFIKLDRREVEIALGKREGEPRKTIQNQIEKMSRYVIPPKFDFINNEGLVDPILMYLFEFNHTLDQKDLMDIWQNLPPKISYEFEEQEVSLTINSKDFSFIKNIEEYQWLIFKVKKKAAINYFKKTLSNADDGRFNFQFASEDGNVRNIIPKFSYNWPYDYFSLVELAKVDSEVIIAPEEEAPVTVRPPRKNPLPKPKRDIKKEFDVPTSAPPQNVSTQEFNSTEENNIQNATIPSGQSGLSNVANLVNAPKEEITPDKLIGKKVRRR